MLKPGMLDLVKEIYREIVQLPEFSKNSMISCDLVHETSEKRLKSYTDDEKKFVKECSL